MIFLFRRVHSFGTIKEENPDQLSLFEEDCQALPPSESEEVIVVHRRKKKRKGHKAELLKDLPAQEVHYELIGENCQCPECQENLKEIGRKLIREEPVFFPARLEKKSTSSIDTAVLIANKKVKQKFLKRRFLVRYCRIVWQVPA